MGPLRRWRCRVGTPASALLLAAALSASCQPAVSRAGEGRPAAAIGSLPEGWQRYTDERHGFTLGHPPAFVPLAEPSAESSELRLRLRFLDRSQVQSPLAGRAVPTLAVEVWDNREEVSIEEWLDRHPRLAGAEPREVEHVLVGTLPGLRIRTARMLAPNDVLFVARGRQIFRLVPAGREAERMLASFAFTDQRRVGGK